MSICLEIVRAGPLATVQDAGRFGALGSGLSASGPMDRRGWMVAGRNLSATSGLEFTQAGLDFRVRGGSVVAGVGGGLFSLSVNGQRHDWPAYIDLADGDTVSIEPGSAGNYGYVRFNAEIDVPMVMNSRATNLIVGIGGFEGRALKAGDMVPLLSGASGVPSGVPGQGDGEGAVRVIWGLHAERFDPGPREAFVTEPFRISRRLDRMGVRLEDISGVFAEARHLSLVSDSVVPGDIQILGDGTPIVLMRDHQPTGGYPRIATLISADLDRFAQMRPGTELRFTSVSVDHAQQIARRAGP